MNKVINVNENSAEFLGDLQRRIRVAQNSENRISLENAKKDILAKYRELTNAKV